MISQLYVNNFRCFVNFRLPLKSKQVIVGDNGSGKSTIFEVLWLLRKFAIDGEPAADLFTSATDTRWFDTDGQVFELDAQLADGLFRYHLRLDRKSRAKPEVSDERVTLDGRLLFSFIDGNVQLYSDQHEEGAKYPFDWRRSALATISSRSDNQKLTAFKDYLGSVLCVHVNPRTMDALADAKNATLDRDGKNFATWYRHAQAQDAPASKDLRDDLRNVLPGFDSIVLKPMGGNWLELSARFTDQRPRRAGGGVLRTGDFDFSELSDGQRTLVVLYALLRFAIQRGRTVCIDEPDNYLALAEIEPWLNEVLDTVDDGDGQVLIITHHPEIIDRTVLEMGIQLIRNGLEPVRAAPFQQPVDSHISPSERMARGWTDE